MPLALLAVLAAVSDVHLERPASRGDAVRRVLTFKDARGENKVEWVIGPTKEKDEVKSRAMTVEATWRKNARGRWNRLWSAKDFVNECDADVALTLADASVVVTDLDDDGIGEVAFVYQLGCRSDVSPLDMKLLMYEGADKYAMRGESRVRVSEKEVAGGDVKPDAAFEKAPARFLEHAKVLWAKNVGPSD